MTKDFDLQAFQIEIQRELHAQGQSVPALSNGLLEYMANNSGSRWIRRLERPRRARQLEGRVERLEEQLKQLETSNLRWEAERAIEKISERYKYERMRSQKDDIWYAWVLWDLEQRKDQILEDLVKQLVLERRRIFEAYIGELLEMEPEHSGVKQAKKKLKTRNQLTLTDLETISTLRQKTSDRKAKELIDRKDIRDYLCPALQMISEDVFTVSNTVAQVLAPLVIAGVLSIPLVPVLFASLAIWITRLGITSICDDHNQT